MSPLQAFAWEALAIAVLGGAALWVIHSLEKWDREDDDDDFWW